MDTLFWLIVMCIMLGVEVSTLGLTTIWFAAGAFVTSILSLFVDMPKLEWFIFLIGSTVALIVLRPLFINKLNARRTKTNLDSITDKIGRVTEDINNELGTGAVFVDGKEWTARSKDDSQLIAAGSRVRILEISGVKLIVAPEAE